MKPFLIILILILACFTLFYVNRTRSEISTLSKKVKLAEIDRDNIRVRLADKIDDLQFLTKQLQRRVDTANKASSMFLPVKTGILEFRYGNNFLNMKIKAIKPYGQGSKVWITFINDISREDVSDLVGRIDFASPINTNFTTHQEFTLKANLLPGSSVTKEFTLPRVPPKKIKVITISDMWGTVHAGP